MKLDSPEILTESLAVMLMAPASPIPRNRVVALSRAPSVREREPVSIVILPAFPVALGLISLKIPLTLPSLSSPEILTESAAVIEIAPPLPSALIPDAIRAPFVRKRDPVVILTAPPSPKFPEVSTRPLILISSVALRVTAPLAPVG